MDSRIKELKQTGDDLFAKRFSLTSLWQTIAENFYIERADFTAQRYLGNEFGMNNLTSYPMLARRTLGDLFSSMLRPVEQEWFSVHTLREDKEDDAAKKWLEQSQKVQKRAMYDKATMFNVATKQADHDFAAFGQCVLTAELNRESNTLLYRTWHLRDVAWTQRFDGKVGDIHRKWKPTLCVLEQTFPGKMSDKARKRFEKNPNDEIEVRCVRVDSKYYENSTGKKWKHPYVFVTFEEASGEILEEMSDWNRRYIIPRWQTVSGWQYAYSPAVVCALPDARLIQAMTLTLLEVGEKAANPPLKTPGDVLRSDINTFAGGITAYDADYDESTGRILEPLYQVEKSGLQFAIQMREDTKSSISQAFYLDKLGLPPTVNSHDMTAYEVGQRVQEYIRNARPLFEPIEQEYNAELCDVTFEILMKNGAFGAPQDMPQALRGADIQFAFESPLHQAIDKQKAQIFQQANALVAEAVQADPSSRFIIDAKTALRDTLEGFGVPAMWMNSPEQVMQMSDNEAKAQQAQQALAMIKAGGDAANALGQGGAALNQMMGPQQ